MKLYYHLKKIITKNFEYSDIDKITEYAKEASVEEIKKSIDLLLNLAKSEKERAGFLKKIYYGIKEKPDYIEKLKENQYCLKLLEIDSGDLLTLKVLSWDFGFVSKEESSELLAILAEYDQNEIPIELAEFVSTYFSSYKIDEIDLGLLRQIIYENNEASIIIRELCPQLFALNNEENIPFIFEIMKNDIGLAESILSDIFSTDEKRKNKFIEKLDFKAIDEEELSIIEYSYLLDNFELKKWLISEFFKKYEDAKDFIERRINKYEMAPAYFFTIFAPDTDKIIRLLKNNNINLSLKNGRSDSILHFAFYMYADHSAEDQLNKVKQLLNGGIDPNLKDKNGQTLLFFAFIENNMILSKILQEKGASLNVRDNYGRLCYTYIKSEALRKKLTYKKTNESPLKLSKVSIIKS